MNCQVYLKNKPIVNFFDDEEVMPKYPVKVYHDGSHHVATLITKRKAREKAREIQDIDVVFNQLYDKAVVELGLSKREIKNYIVDELGALHEDKPDLTEYVENNIERREHNAYLKLKRFRRKAYLNEWNYFATFTYSDEKQTEESFRARLKKCFSNFAVRRSWRLMGVFERAPETKRLHFHCLLYVPPGEMPGEIKEVRDYSTKNHRMQVSNCNSFFLETFGRNDFQRIDSNKFSVKRCIGYICKYLEKTGESIMYSRGIPTELSMNIERSDIANDFCDFVIKFALYDQVFEAGVEEPEEDLPSVDLYNMLC